MGLALKVRFYVGRYCVFRHLSLRESLGYPTHQGTAFRDSKFARRLLRRALGRPVRFFGPVQGQGQSQGKGQAGIKGDRVGLGSEGAKRES